MLDASVLCACAYFLSTKEETRTLCALAPSSPWSSWLTSLEPHEVCLALISPPLASQPGEATPEEVLCRPPPAIEQTRSSASGSWGVSARALASGAWWSAEAAAASGASPWHRAASSGLVVPPGRSLIWRSSLRATSVALVEWVQIGRVPRAREDEAPPSPAGWSSIS